MASRPSNVRDSLWASGQDEQVEVNQRALIDKVLARYSGEFTVFRELLQNADDAQAQRAEIRFDSKAFIDNPSAGVTSDRLPNLKKEPIHQWTFRNDGMPFREEDWSRLKKIAEGNPDEEKIGAFGVGFYSLFSVTEEPFVKSGSSWMGFYWRDGKDQLYARRGQLPPSEAAPDPGSNPWTSFEMVLREAGPLPAPPVELARFVATSLTFMNRLREVSVFFNDKRLVRIVKEVDDPRTMTVPRNLNNVSPMGIMNVRGIDLTAVRMKAEILRWVYTTGLAKPHIAIPAPIQQAASGFFSSLFSRRAAATPAPPEPVAAAPPEPDPFIVIESNVNLSVYSAQVDVKMDRKLLSELERATKKKPPTRSVYQLIYTSKVDYDASKKEDEREFQSTGSVFRGLRADLDGGGTARVFIGQATAQTTGVGGHMAARFIPTVERESIDLVDRHVSQWNKELLFVGGYLCRAVWEFKMADVGARWKSTTDADARKDLVQACLHVMRFFSVYRASPSSTFSDYIEAAFFACAKDRSIPLLSTAGVMNADKIRMPTPEFSAFLKQLPVLPDQFVFGASRFVSTLRDKNFIREITLADVLEELKSRPLSEQEMIDCLKWRIGLNTEGVGSHSDLLRSQFLHAGVFTLPSGNGSEKVVSLSAIKTYLIPRGVSAIPTDVPLPETTLPYSISKNLNLEKLTQLFGWTELKLVDWLAFISREDRAGETNMTVSPAFAERVFTIAARGWPSLSDESRAAVVQVLQPKACIPTTQGMGKGAEAYFPTAHIFGELPIIQFSKAAPTTKSPLEKLLLALGVRKHVDLQVVFNRMITTGDWSISDLVQYLVAVKDTLTTEEMLRLRHTAAFPCEGRGPLSTENRWMAQDLYEPSDTLRQLGLPIIAWETKWKPHSDEAKFLSSLGLNRYPSTEAILQRAAGDPPTSQLALEYFLNNYTDRYSNDYNPQKFSQFAFVPAVQPDGQAIRAKPTEAYLNADCAVFGFNVLEPTFRSSAAKFKLAEHPPIGVIVSKLISTPPSRIPLAKEMFEYMSNRLGELTSADLNRLSEAPIVPHVGSKGSEAAIVMLRPVDCYFGSSQAAGQFHSKLFHFVDFEARANAFLRQCGVKSEPTVQEIAKMLVSNPRRFYDLAGSPERYLAELRNMAANRHLLPASLRNNLKKSPFLLCTRREASKSSPKLSRADEEEEDMVYAFELRKADEIVIVDDPSAYALFGTSLLGAPQEDTLEVFYEQLGSRRLSRLVTEEYKPSGVIERSRRAQETRTLILERLPLFLHERISAEGRGNLLLKPDWLSDEANFQVIGVRSLRLTRQLQYNSTRLTHTTEASAGVRRDGPRSPVCMWVSAGDALDMYEVANALCNVLFEKHSANDSLLFSTLLSTDLRALRRRGYAINRILQQQKIRQEAIDAQERERRLQIEASGATSSDDQSAREAKTSNNPNAFNGAGLLNTWNSVRNRLQKVAAPQAPQIEPMTASDTQEPPPYPGGSVEGYPNPNGSLPPPPIPPRTGMGRSPRPDAHVTPIQNIEANLNQAIAACRPERSNLLHNRREMNIVREALDEGYCDASGTVGELIFVGDVLEHRFYTRDVHEPRAFFELKQEPLLRFSSSVITPIGQLFKVPQSSLHIFYDTTGPLIAFNRNGSIFMNLRFYEAWHDEQVREGNLTKALISWYFTLGHEIAHNLVQPHNSEHEFYFSSLCESNLPSLATLIAGR